MTQKNLNYKIRDSLFVAAKFKGEIIIKNINRLKFLIVINPVILILSIYVADINHFWMKSLLAGSVIILCSLEYSLLDKLCEDRRED